MKSTRVTDGEALPVSAPVGDSFDVIVAGAGLAGCTAARLFAMEGLRVALVKHHNDISAFKQLCTHFIQASATPTLRRLCLDHLIEEAGGIRSGITRIRSTHPPCAAQYAPTCWRPPCDPYSKSCLPGQWSSLHSVSRHPMCSPRQQRTLSDRGHWSR
ncbi:FAD-dependent oxidoreductase [Paraburkholderia sp. GAS334]|uniref:FAD-dependent oxidoreductase n=1 Tax=Paraburkholderia sp. GAS334 TaxID=3035131 RepID=UPI003D1CE020